MTRTNLRYDSKRFFCALGVATACILGSSPVAATTVLLGWLEWGQLEPDHIVIKTKLDTGAKTSSIHAEDIEEFERDDETWVRFRIPLASRPDDSDYGKDVVMERKVLRTVRIKDHVDVNPPRYVVKIEICVGGMTFETPASLADRSRFNYPLLLGRTAMRKRIIVDPARTFTADDACDERRKKP